MEFRQASLLVGVFLGHWAFALSSKTIEEGKNPY
jgi:hypothetical protein